MGSLAKYATAYVRRVICARACRCSEVTVFAHVRPNGDDGWLPDWLIDKVHFDQVTCLIALDKYLAELDDDFECATPKP